MFFIYNFNDNNNSILDIYVHICQMSRPIYRDVLQRLIEKLRTLVDFKKKIVKRGLDKAGVQQNIQILISRGGEGCRGGGGRGGIFL